MLFQENLEKLDPYVIEDRAKDKDAFLIEGNEAVALGALYGGLTLLAWYPITPSSSLAESIIEWIPKLRLNKDGKSTCAVIVSSFAFFGSTKSKPHRTYMPS